MKRHSSNPLPYFLVPVKPGTEAEFRRWTYLIVSTLGILVLGLLSVAFVAQMQKRTALGTKNHGKGRKHPATTQIEEDLDELSRYSA